MMKRSTAVGVTIVTAAVFAASAVLTGSQESGAATPMNDSANVAIVPQPVSMTQRAGRFRLTPRTVIAPDEASVAIAHQLARYVEPATGFTLRVQTGVAPATNAIVLHRDATLSR